MDVLLPTVSAIGPCAAALGLGWFLRQSVCNETDGEVHITIAELGISLKNITHMFIDRFCLLAVCCKVCALDHPSFPNTPEFQ